MKWPAPIWMCAMASVVTAAGVSAILLTPVERRGEVHEPPVEQAFRRHIPQSEIARAHIADLSGRPGVDSPRLVHRPPRPIDAPTLDAAEPARSTPTAVAMGSTRFEAPWPQARTTQPAAAAAAAATSGGNPSAAVIPSIPSAPSS